jgi:hypothetical protein
LKAERARFLSRRERRAKPETEPLLPRWGQKRRVFESQSRSIRFSHPLLFAYLLKRMIREWQEKSEGSKGISKIISAVPYLDFLFSIAKSRKANYNPCVRGPSRKEKSLYIR